MINIAILGFGVVGGGITEVIEQNKKALKAYVGDDIYVKKILDLREFPDSPYGDRVVHDVNEIVGDPDIALVCETMGGVNPAFDFSCAMLKAGKHMVTANKELVAKKGLELTSLAKENGVHYFFEPSVGGGIPEIRSMRTSLAGDTITAIDGILNGTTNYILTRMKREGVDFTSTLKDAQRLGYAEANPSADVDGLDAQRKIMILTAVATGYLVKEEDVYCETMTKLTPADIDAAKRWGGAVKLLGSSRIDEDEASLYVAPFFVPESSPLAFVEDVYNAIHVTSPVTGDVMYYGRGAGRMPTAGAVVEDVASILSGLAAKEKKCEWQAAPAGYVKPFSENTFAYYIRTKADSKLEALEAAALSFGGITEIPGTPENVCEYITAEIEEKTAQEIIGSGALGEVESVIRIMK
ncbi:MAG: homoserine dehydrogenase [Clostridia bacterium]|nr:homoserine dehydrogenase [Clostridia bacterium]